MKNSKIMKILKKNLKFENKTNSDLGESTKKYLQKTKSLKLNQFSFQKKNFEKLKKSILRVKKKFSDKKKKNKQIEKNLISKVQNLTILNKNIRLLNKKIFYILLKQYKINDITLIYNKNINKNILLIFENIYNLKLKWIKNQIFQFTKLDEKIDEKFVFIKKEIIKNKKKMNQLYIYNLLNKKTFFILNRKVEKDFIKKKKKIQMEFYSAI